MNDGIALPSHAYRRAMSVRIRDASRQSLCRRRHFDRIRDADKLPGDWTTYHGSYRSWHFSALDQ